MNKPILCSFLLGLLLAGCGGKEPVRPVTRTDLIREYMRGNGTNSSAAAVHGEETGFAYGAILGVGGTNANGVGFLRKYADGVSVATVNLNIERASDSQYYVVWTSNGAAIQYPMIFRGELRSIVGDARHSLQFELTENDGSLLRVITTLESSVSPDQPSAAIAEGTLKGLQYP